MKNERYEYICFDCGSEDEIDEEISRCPECLSCNIECEEKE